MARTLFFTCLSLIMAGCQLFQQPAAQQLPAFDLMLPDSTVFNTAAIPAGRPVLLVLFDGECSECHHEVSAITGRMQELQNVQFYLVSLEPLSGIRRFREHFQLHRYANITVARDTAGFLPQYLQTRTTPYMALYDKEKRLRGIFAGKAPVDTLISYVRRL